MPFPELEKYKRQSPRLANLLSHLEAYLGEVLDRPDSNVHDLHHPVYDVVPVLVAKALGIDEGLALVLLRVCEEAGIIVHRYDVYCPNIEQSIESFNSKDDLPEFISCPYEVRTEHSIDEYFIELVFNFSSKFVREHKLAVSM